MNILSRFSRKYGLIRVMDFMVPGLWLRVSGFWSRKIPGDVLRDANLIKIIAINISAVDHKGKANRFLISDFGLRIFTVGILDSFDFGFRTVDCGFNLQNTLFEVGSSVFDVHFWVNPSPRTAQTATRTAQPDT